MDTGTHLRAIWQRRFWVLGGATLVAMTVLLLRLTASPIWTADASLFFVLGEQERSSANDPVSRLSAAYVELLRDDAVLADTARRAGVDIEVVEESVSASAPVDGQLVVSGSQPTAEQAVTLANAAAEALSAAALVEQAEAQQRELAPLDAELARVTAELATVPTDSAAAAVLRTRQDRALQARVDELAATRTRLDLVQRARESQAARTPAPLRDAGLAFLLSLIVIAEAAALQAARRKGIEGTDAVPALESWTSLPVFRLGRSSHGPDETAAAIRFLSAGDPDARPVLVLAPLQPTAGAATGIAAVLETLVVLQGTATWLDLGVDVAGPPDMAGVKRVAGRKRPPAELIRALTPGRTAVASADAWESPLLLRLVDVTPVVCSLVVDAREARQPDLQEALQVLTHAGMPAQAVLVVEGARRWGRDGGRRIWALPKDDSPAAKAPSGRQVRTGARAS